MALLCGWWGRRWTVDEVRDHLAHASVTTTERYLHWVDAAAAARAAETAGGLAMLPDRDDDESAGDTGGVGGAFGRGAAHLRVVGSGPIAVPSAARALAETTENAAD